jgi:hypothetical protein
VSGATTRLCVGNQRSRTHTVADNCAGGLTCDNPSASCVPCRSACSNACARTFAPAPTVPPEMLCPSLDCYQCRSMNSTCKYCNLGGDGNCAAADVYCPSNYAKGDDSIQCGGVLKAPTLPLRINANCSKETCQGCFSVCHELRVCVCVCVADSLRACSKQQYPNCKFCNAMGDWSCVSTAATCPSGAQTNPPPVVDLCGAVRCALRGRRCVIASDAHRRCPRATQIAASTATACTTCTAC